MHEVRGRLGRWRLVRLGLIPAVIVLVAAFATPASADYQQVAEHFGVGGEAEHLQGATGIAINAAGVGGVEAGSFYVVGENHLVLRYGPGTAGESPPFREAWGWGVGNGAPEYQRCGPALTTDSLQHTFSSCTFPSPGGGEEPGHFLVLGSVAVDQATGDVYVLNVHAGGGREHHLIEVFTAKGVPIGEGFGDAGSETQIPPESIAEGPEKLHFLFPSQASIAVSDTGVVFVNDGDYNQVVGGVQRIMRFEPCSTGDYEHYCYAVGKDIPAPEDAVFIRMALVPSDRLVAATPENIYEYELGGTPSAICSYVVSGQLKSMTANPVTGEVFYYVAGTDKRIHRLTACNSTTGGFVEAQEPIRPEPETRKLSAMAVNPQLAWNFLRPEGTLYAVDAEGHTSPLNRGIGDVFAPAEILSPSVESESVAVALPTSVALQAQIDARGHATSFVFEYLSQAEYSANGESFEGVNQAKRAPALGEGKLIGLGIGTASETIESLLPDTEYRFRVVASSECEGSPPVHPLCVGVGAPASFRTQRPAAGGLPDQRAYELVSPVQKNGGEVFPAAPRLGSCQGECKPPGGGITSVFPMQSAPNGDVVAYMGFPFSSDEGAATFNSYISRRGAGGWETIAASPRLLATKGGEDLAYSAQLDQGVVDQPTEPRLSTAAPTGYANLYLQQDTNYPSALTPLLTATPPHRGPGSFVLEYGGHSPNFASQYFAANDALTGATQFAPAPPDPGASNLDLYEWREGTLSVVNVLPGNLAVASGAAFASSSPDTHAVSNDGRRVYWESAGHLYEREDGQVTREIKQAGKFLVAAESGLTVLLSNGCLYSLLTEACTDLSEGQGGFEGVAGQSGALSKIYFVDTAALAGSGLNERHQEAEAGKPNLYLFETAGTTRFIATLATSDGSNTTGTLADWAPAPGARTAEASPDGRFLAFASTRELTGYDNVGPCQEVSGEFKDVPCKEVFIYDSTTARLSCPSCNPTLEPPRGNSILRRIEGAESVRAWIPQPRYLTNSGRLAFDSQDRLSPYDTNGRVEDVYEEEPAGVGSCVQSGGCVSLISAGRGSIDSNFIAMDQSGANIFFTTRERLVARDTDELIDVYDAREGGGFPNETEKSPPECQGEACQAPTGSPLSPISGSSSFQGPGNVKPHKPKTCQKGRKKRKGKCVRKATQKPHKNRKHHNNRKHGSPANKKKGGAK